MARVTVEDCLRHEENRFALVVLAAKRARALLKGTGSLVHSKNREAVTALREIAAQKVSYSTSVDGIIREYIRETKAKNK